MRSRSLLVVSVLGSVATLALACSSSDYPNPVLTFNSGQEDDTFEDVTRFDVERIDSTSGDSKRLLRDSTLPESLDMGDSGTYQFVGTGYDAAKNPVAVGRTLTADLADLAGTEVPLFFARTDRASRPLGSFVGTPKQNPVAGVQWGRYIWYFDDSSTETLETDSYSIAYWERVPPPDAYLSIDCPKVPCNLKNLVVVGSVYAIAIADDWALGIDTVNQFGGVYTPPDGLADWADIAGGRTLPDEGGAAVLVGPTRQGDPTRAVLAFSADNDVVNVVYLETNTKRAGAALLYEEGFGMVIAGGSSKGAGLERLKPKGTEFVALPYPADPVVGAALVMEDETHLLRVGGLTADGLAAPTVRIDVECSKNCTYDETVPALDVALQNAQSYYDAETEQTLVVGEDENGLTLVYRYQASGFKAITVPKAQQRVRAAALELPNQQLALVGGTDPDDATLSRQAISVIAF